MSNPDIMFVTVTGTTSVFSTAAVSQAVKSEGELEPVVVTVLKTTTVAPTHSAAPEPAPSTLLTNVKSHASASAFQSRSQVSLSAVTLQSATSSQQSQPPSHASAFPSSYRTEQPPTRSLPTSFATPSSSSNDAHNSATAIRGSESSGGGKIGLYLVLPVVLYIIATALVILTIVWCNRKCNPKPDLEAARKSLGTTPVIIAQNEQARRERINEYVNDVPVAGSACTGSSRGSSGNSQASKATTWPSLPQRSSMPEDREPTIVLQPVEDDIPSGLPLDDVATYPMRLDRDFYKSDGPGVFVHPTDHGATYPSSEAVGESAFADGWYVRCNSVEEAERRARIHMDGVFPSGGTEVEEYVEMKKKAATPGEDAELWNGRAEKIVERLIKLRRMRSPDGVGFEGGNPDNEGGWMAGQKIAGWRNLLRV